MDNNGRLIIEQIRNKNFASLYVLEGEEPYYINQIVSIMESEIIPEEEKDFNQTILYGNEVTAKDVVSEALRIPMFGERILIIVKEAQQLKNTETLVPYFLNPNPTTILVLEHRDKSIDKRSKLFKVIQKVATHYVSFKIKESELPNWIVAACHNMNLKISYELANMLSIYLGNDLQKINNELEKIKINEPNLTEITAQIIERQVGISREYNIFELNNAVFQNEKERIARMLNYFNANPKEVSMPRLLSNFHAFLQQVFLCYYTTQDFNNDRKLGIFSHHRRFASQYNISYHHQLSSLLEEYSRKAVGIDSSYSASPHLLKEMLARIGNVLDYK